MITEFAEGDLFQVLEDDKNLPEPQVTLASTSFSFAVCTVSSMIRFRPLLAILSRHCFTFTLVGSFTVT